MDVLFTPLIVCISSLGIGIHQYTSPSMTPWLDVLLAHLISLHHCMRPNINHLIIIIAMVDSALSLSSLREQKKDSVIEE